MKTHTVKLKNRRWVAVQTAAFILERPPGYDYVAGQFTDVKVGEKSHTFTLASAPHESDLMFATRMRKSEFKEALDGLEPGATLRITPASGEFTLGKDNEHTVFIAGGIGVTPVRSMVLDAQERNERRPLVFFYANHRPEDAAYLEELRRLEENTDNFTIVPTMTRPDIAELAWDGETGHVDAEMIRKHVPELGQAHYYVSGPPEMVDSTEAMLRKANVPEERVHVEHFAGY